MNRIAAVCLAALVLTSCAVQQDRTFESRAIRAEVDAAHEPAPDRAASAPSQTPALVDDIDYNRQRLSVEPVGMSAGLWGGGPYLGSSSSMSWRKWLAYKGFSLISEPEFFQITGYEEEAQRAQSHYSGAIAETVGGGLLATVGLVFLAAGYGETPIDWTQANIGYLSALTGLAVMWHGGTRMDQNWAPYDLAKGIADQYNARLLMGDSER
jgi:hypothetical protein